MKYLTLFLALTLNASASYAKCTPELSAMAHDLVTLNGYDKSLMVLTKDFFSGWRRFSQGLRDLSARKELATSEHLKWINREIAITEAALHSETPDFIEVSIKKNGPIAIECAKRNVSLECSEIVQKFQEANLRFLDFDNEYRRIFKMNIVSLSSYKEKVSSAISSKISLPDPVELFKTVEYVERKMKNRDSDREKLLHETDWGYLAPADACLKGH